MNDIRDLLSGHMNIEQIVFTQAVGLDSGPSQTHCYLAAASTGRFLLMSLASAAEADHPIELSERTWVYARSAELDFVKNTDQPVVASRPRSQREPDLEKVFKVMESIPMGCIQLGLPFVKPGSIRWEGDRFVAEYVTVEGERRMSVRITNADGTEAPEEYKAMVLADMEAEPKDRKLKATFAGKGIKATKLLTAAEAEAARRASKPAPGSIEARILALWDAREKERLRKGIQGSLVRDEQRRVRTILLQSEPESRLELDYEQPGGLPPPFPNRTRTFIQHAEAKPGVPSSELTIHSVRVSEQPLKDEAFDPSLRLKAGSFVRGLLRPDGSRFIPDQADRRFVNEWLRRKYVRARGPGDLGAE
jgi:hypothetical protein